MNQIVQGSSIVIDPLVVPINGNFFKNVGGEGQLHYFGLEHGKVYRPSNVQVVPEEQLRLLHEVDCFGKRPRTNHDLMGSDRTVEINGTVFSAMFFRQATAAEVNKEAKSKL